MYKLLVLVTLGSASLVSADSNSQAGQSRQQSQGSSNSPSSRAVSDQEISPKIREVLNSGNFKEVKFQLKNGNVILIGATNSLENRIALAKTILNIDGVKSVNNQLNVQLGGDSDNEIINKIQDMFNTRIFTNGFQKVSFQVTNGIVVLMGTVDTQDNKNKVEQAIKRIPGVMSIENKISIKNK